jgi:hypothetical protein
VRVSDCPASGQLPAASGQRPAASCQRPPYRQPRRRTAPQRRPTRARRRLRRPGRPTRSLPTGGRRRRGLGARPPANRRLTDRRCARWRTTQVLPPPRSGPVSTCRLSASPSVSADACAAATRLLRARLADLKRAIGLLGFEHLSHQVLGRIFLKCHSAMQPDGPVPKPLDQRFGHVVR